MQELTIDLGDGKPLQFVGPFRCVGLVRGWCGHEHRTISGALRCIDRDTRGCSAQGGYSDRVIRDSQDRVIPAWALREA